MRSNDVPPPKPTRKPRQRAPGGGRPPKPTALHVLEGTRPDRKRPNEPKPPPVSRAVAPPAWLSKLRDNGLASGFFRRVARYLVTVRCLGKGDVEALAAVAETYSVYRRAVRDLPPRFVRDANGRVPPVFGIRARALHDLHAGLVQFGLTPVARTRVIAGDDVPLPPSVAGTPADASADRGGDWLRAHAPRARSS